MAASRVSNLDVVSRVTILIFLGQLLFGGLLAFLSPKGFSLTFAGLLLFSAAIQTFLALCAERRPSASSLNEWDGISWLLLVATVCLLVDV